MYTEFQWQKTEKGIPTIKHTNKYFNNMFKINGEFQSTETKIPNITQRITHDTAKI